MSLFDFLKWLFEFSLGGGFWRFAGCGAIMALLIQGAWATATSAAALIAAIFKKEQSK